MMEVLAVAVLCIHLAWILWAIAGALWTRGHGLLTAFHVLSLAEQWFEARAGMQPTPEWTGGFLVHYLEAVIYPDLPAWLITGFGVAVCVFNLGIYARRLWEARHDAFR